MEQDTAFGIEKLRPNNFKEWTINMKHILKKKDLWNAVQGEEPDDFMKRKALRTIALSVTPDLQNLILDTDDPKEAWNILQHALPTPKKLFEMRRNFFSEQKGRSETIPTYVNRILTQAKTLDKHGMKINDEDVAWTLLSGLPPPYSRVRKRTEMLSDNQFTAENVSRMILDEFSKTGHSTKVKNMKCVVSSTSLTDISERPSSVRIHPREVSPPIPMEPSSMRENSILSYSPNGSETTLLGSNRNLKRPLRRSLIPVPSFELNTKSKRARGVSSATICTPMPYCSSIPKWENYDDWIIHSGATHHMATKRDFFKPYMVQSSSMCVTCAIGGISLEMAGKGCVELRVDLDSGEDIVVLNDVLHVPKLPCNILSVGKAEEKGCEVLFGNGKCIIRDSEGRVIIKAVRTSNGLFNILGGTVVPKDGAKL